MSFILATFGSLATSIRAFPYARSSHKHPWLTTSLRLPQSFAAPNHGPETMLIEQFDEDLVASRHAKGPAAGKRQCPCHDASAKAKDPAQLSELVPQRAKGLVDAVAKALGRDQKAYAKLFMRAHVMMEWVGGRAGGWINGWLDGWVDGCMDGWLAGWLAGWVDRCMDGWMAGWVDGRMDGWMAG